MARTPQKPHGRYPLLAQVTDPVAQQIHKLVYDRLSTLEQSTQAVEAAVAKITPGLSTAQVQALIRQAVVVAPPSPRVPSTVPGSPTPPASTVCNMDITLGQPAGIPAAPNKRWFRGNFGGIRVPGLPGIQDGPNNSVPGGDTSMLWTPFFNRYPAVWQAKALTAYVARGYTHFEMAWSSARDDGVSPADFITLAQQIQSAGLYPVIELLGKGDPGSADDLIASAMTIITPAIAAGVIPIAYIGKELNLWLSPTDLQALIDGVAPTLVAAGTNVYVHFSSGYMSWQIDGHVKDFWIPNVGKLTGLLYQMDPSWDCPTLQNDAYTILTRCAGNNGMPADSGFGHPFDAVAYEMTAEIQFFPPNISEAAGDQRGFNAICSPAQTGPGGTAAYQGFGNGCARPDGSRL